MEWIRQPEDFTSNVILFFKKTFKQMDMDSQIMIDKLINLRKILDGLFMTYKMDVEQLTLDLLEEFDYMLEHVDKHPYDFEITFYEIVAKAKSIKQEGLGEKDVEVLGKIKSIKYEEL